LPANLLIAVSPYRVPTGVVERPGRERPGLARGCLAVYQRDAVVPSPSRPALLVYGTLLDDQRVRALTGRTFRRQDAVLDGYRRVWPRTAHPRLVPDPLASVSGILLFGIDAAALAALDAYEEVGRLYVRERVVVTCGGRRVRCWVSQARRPRERRRRRASRA
jgi:gamma-glutamylcyclotransferase (GGCT)/AIG2-like uncharacterized protein YtfP